MLDATSVLQVFRFDPLYDVGGHEVCRISKFRSTFNLPELLFLW